jgi:hypothetical protein
MQSILTRWCTFLLVSTVPFVCAGQATFIFNNYTASADLDAPVFDAGGIRLFGTNYVAELYGGVTMDSLVLAQAGSASMEPVPFTRIRDDQTGYFAHVGFVHFLNVPSGGFAWLQVRAWDLRLGETYEEVANRGLGGYGQSALFYTYGGDLGAEGRPPQPLRGLQSFSLVPEPSTWALLVLGGGWLVWRCRRNR